MRAAAPAECRGPNCPPAIAAWSKNTDKIDVDRATAIQFLSDSFSFCSSAVNGMSPEKLSAMVGPEGRQMSAFEALWSYFTHTAHHRGQAEVYLRVKGIKPPDYVF